MRLSGIKISIAVLFTLFVARCNPDSGLELRTEIRFLYEDCLNYPVKHTSAIPTNINNIKVSLIKDGKTVLEKEIKNENAQTSVLINDIEPYDKYRLNVRAQTKENIYWSGFAENVEIKPRSKTFVQINLTREKALTCADYINNKRFMHSSVRLRDGRILIFGGINSITKDYDIYHLESLEKAEIFYPYKTEYADNINTGIIAGSSNTLDSKMVSGRIGYIFEELSDGRILIAGGIDRADMTKNPNDFFICLNENTAFVYDIEIFDPSKNSFSVAGRLKTPFAFAQSVRIGSKIYIFGGIGPGFDCKDPGAGGINDNLITIDLSDSISAKISEEKNTDIAFFAGGKIRLAENKYLFYGGNRDDGFILSQDGKISKVAFEVSPDFGSMIPQKQYFPEAFEVKSGSLYLNITGYNKVITGRYYIRIISDQKIQIEPDKLTSEPVFGSSNIMVNNYLFQTGGIKSIPFTISDMFSVSRVNPSGYDISDSSKTGVDKLKRERVFHSSVKIEDNTFLITGGLYFNQTQNAIILDTAEIYNGYGLTDH